MSITFSMTHHFNGTPEEVFETMTDPNQFEHWMQNFVRSEVESPDGQFGVGTRISETRRYFGREATEVFEITHYDPPRAISLHVDSCRGSTYDFDHRFEPDGDGTRMVMDARIDGGGCMTKLLGKSMCGIFKKAMRKDLVALNDYILSKESA